MLQNLKKYLHELGDKSASVANCLGGGGYVLPAICCIVLLHMAPGRLITNDSNSDEKAVSKETAI